MWRRLVLSLALALCGGLLLNPGAAAAEPEAPALTDGVIMVAGNTVDLQWTTANYITGDFKSVEIRRTAEGQGTVKAFTSDTTAPVSFRDVGLAVGKKYTYEILHYECAVWSPPTPPSYHCRYNSKYLSTVDTAALSGQVTQDLQLVAGTYTGWLRVSQGVHLAMQSGTTINGGSYFYGGTLELDGVTFGGADIRFGLRRDGSSGTGWVKNCHFLGDSYIGLENAGGPVDLLGNTFENSGSSVHVDGSGSVRMANNTGLGSLWLNDTASAELSNNVLTSVLLRDANHLTSEYDTLSEGVYVNGAGSVAEVRHAAISTTDSTYLGEEGYGIFAYTGTTVTAEDNTLTYVGDDAEYGITMIRAEGDAVLIARRNRVMGAIAVNDDVEATLTDNVITKVGLAVDTARAREITGNTIQDARHVTFYKAVPAAATITNNCFRNLSLWVNVEGPRSGYLNLRGNYWGDKSGPKTSANPGGSGVPLSGAYYAYWDPFDRTGAMCRDEPPQPPVDVSSLEVTADPDRLVPNGSDTAWITAAARNAAGEPSAGADIVFAAPFLMGRWADLDRCTTGADGRCRVQYVAPTPQEAAFGPDDVVLSASAGGHTDQVRIELLYLSVTQVSPPRDTRNVDLAGLSLEAVFNRAVDFATVSGRTFRVTSIDAYAGGVPCEYRRGLAENSIACDLSLANPATDPRAQQGLALTGQIVGGLDGVRTADGRFMKADVTWRIFTTPALAPQILFDQVTEGPVWVGGKPAAVQVDAGLSAESELDWVDADVTLRYPPEAATYTRTRFRFYRTLGTAPLEARLKGNTANFLSAAGEVPIVGPGMVGAHAAHVTVEPSDQLLTLFIDPHAYTAHASVEVRALKGEYWPFRIATYPIVPTDHPLHEFPYPWQSGQEIPEAQTGAVVREGAHYVKLWTPLRDVDQTAGTRAADVWAPLIPHPKNDGAWYLARLVRHADWTVPSALESGVIAVMLVPWSWMSIVNDFLPTYHGPAHHVCLTSVDAPARFNPAAALAYCVGHLSGLPDTVAAPGYVLKGYDVARDRYVDATVVETGYHIRAMAFEQFPNADFHSFWMDRAGYETLADRFVAGGSAAGGAVDAPGAESAAAAAGRAIDSPSVLSITIGGEIVRQANAAETGTIDIVELPARSHGLPTITGGSGDTKLRLLGAGGAVLAEHAFTPEFFTLDGARDYASFLFNVPAVDGVRSVVLVRGTTVLSTLAASANAPTVTIHAPAAGSHSGEIIARWTGIDPDAGAALEYTVLYSTDNAATWQALALSTRAQQLVLDTAQYANCTQCRLKVIANDGFYSAEATSAVFSAANAPRVSLTWPPDGATDAGRFTEVSATFRDAMSAGTITASSFTLVDTAGRPVAGAVTTNVDASEATLTPAAALGYGQQYTARLAGTIRDAGGRPLGADVVWRFTVERDPVTYTYLPLVVKK